MPRFLVISFLSIALCAGALPPEGKELSPATIEILRTAKRQLEVKIKASQKRDLKDEIEAFNAELDDQRLRLVVAFMLEYQARNGNSSPKAMRNYLNNHYADFLTEQEVKQLHESVVETFFEAANFKILPEISQTKKEGL